MAVSLAGTRALAPASTAFILALSCVFCGCCERLQQQTVKSSGGGATVVIVAWFILATAKCSWTHVLASVFLARNVHRPSPPPPKSRSAHKPLSLPSLFRSLTLDGRSSYVLGNDTGATAVTSTRTLIHLQFQFSPAPAGLPFHSPCCKRHSFERTFIGKHERKDYRSRYYDLERVC